MTVRSLTYNGRLPGVAVQLAPEITRQDPLRMDVAGFVGFAERGPLDLPVMVEDIGQYRAIFGGDVFIARHRGRPVYAQLPRAVQAFFENGGRRCYVVRVAGPKARANHFRVPGLTRWTPDDGLQAVVCPAASEGRWSDDVRIATRLHTRALILDRPWNAETMDWFKGGQMAIKLRVPSARTVQRGDLIAVTFDDRFQTRLFARVSEVQQTGVPNAEYTSQRSIPVTVHSTLPSMAAFARAQALPPLETLKAVDYLHPKVGGEIEWYTIPVHRLHDITEPDFTSGELVYLFDFRRTTALVEEIEQHPDSGWLLRLEYEDGLVLVFPITGTRGEQHNTARRTKIECGSLRLSTDALAKVELLTEDGWDDRWIRSPRSDVEYTPGSITAPYRVEFPLSGALIGPEDVLRLTYANGRTFLLVVAGVDLAYTETGTPYLTVLGHALWEEVDIRSDENHDPSTVIKGHPDKVELYTFDLLVREGRETLEAWHGLNFAPGDRPEAQYWADVLAQVPDKSLRSVTVSDLLQRSTRLGIPPGASSGSPALFFPLDMNTGIVPPERYEPARPADDDHLPAHDGLDSLDPITLFLDPNFVILPEVKPDQPEGQPERNVLDEDYLPTEDLYLDDEIRTLPPKEVRRIANEKFFFGVEAARLKKLHSLYMVEEVALIAVPDLGHRLIGCRPIYPTARSREEEGEEMGFHPCPPDAVPQSVFRALVRRSSGYDRAGDTELELYQRLAALPEMELALEPCEPLDEVMLVYEAMIHMAAARGDLLAILSLPYRFDYWDTLEWHRLLTEERVVPEALSYAAVFHSWLEVREQTTPQLLPTRLIPPDGPVCGMIAARDLARGPGVAPANEPLQGVIGLDIMYDETPQLVELYNRQINVVQYRPGKFVTLSAHTLGQGPQFRQISVRRMVMFLRRLVLIEGQRFVFETNNERFRRSVQVHFEQLFERLLRGGSLLAYHVNTGDDLNTPYDIDQGRFLVEIQVAFTYPVEFITIVLLRTGEDMLETIER